MGATGSVLAARVAARDERALEEAFGELGCAVHAAALRVLGDPAAAQDVVQDVFLGLWCHPGRYDAECGSLRTYLTVRARSRAVDVARADGRRVLREERSVLRLPQQHLPSPAEQAIASAVAALVREAVSLLPREQREMVELVYFSGLTQHDAACLTGLPEGTVKSRLRLALARLELLLDRELLQPV